MDFFITPEVVLRSINIEALIGDASPQYPPLDVSSTPLNIKKAMTTYPWQAVVITFSGGGGESRTHVRKRFLKNFSERSWCFVVSPHPTPISRLRIRLSYCSPMLL